MQVLSWNDSAFPQFLGKETAVTIGSFDGLHKGHRVLIDTLTKTCAEKHYISVVITFTRPLPAIKHAGDYAGDISSLPQRLALFESLGIESVILVDFTDKFAAVSGTDFLSSLVQRINMKCLVEGFDFHCGYKGKTERKAIEAWAQDVHVETHFVPPVYYNASNGKTERVSSSFIRQMILEGNFDAATELLQRPFELDLDEMRRKLAEGSSFTQLLPPDGSYHPLSENGSPISIDVKAGKLLNLPECHSLRFV
ncbi:MAG: FAD synthetase family protein [Spirochaetales bacterium]|nr:FAD synthetase family protein [Spirochaetales bacterium]